MRPESIYKVKRGNRYAAQSIPNCPNYREDTAVAHAAMALIRNKQHWSSHVCGGVQDGIMWRQGQRSGANDPLMLNTVRPIVARLPYRIASGRPGEPDAPLNGSGVKMNMNS